MGWNNGLKYGEFVKEIEKLKPDTIIRFDFGYFTPKGFASYRGYYDDCALGYSDEVHDSLTVQNYMEELKTMRGAELRGYKGGLYYIQDDTGLWIAKDYSECTGTIITSVTDLGYGYAIINTAYDH